MRHLSPDQHALLALLAWYRDMGVDAALAEGPIDWFARGDTGESAWAWPPFDAGEARPGGAPSSSGRGGGAAYPPPREPSALAAVGRPPMVSPPPVARPRAFPTAAPDAAETSAQTLAREARTLAELEAAVRGFDGCGLKTTAKNTCFHRGALHARLMLIGEAPGRDEDLVGKPFVGPAGRLLDKMLAAIGLSEADVHIANTVYWRPPGNRAPTAQEQQICRPFLERQVELVGPERLVLVGGVAAKAMLETTDGIMRLRGSWREVTIAGRALPVMATLHPAYLLRTPAAKRMAWRDLLSIKTALAG